MTMEKLVSDTDGGNLKRLEKNLSYYERVFKTKINLNFPELYIKIQSVPRSKHSPSRLYKPVS
jgi:hypothetical protein